MNYVLLLLYFQNEALHRDIVRLFADQQTAPLSIHKIVEMGQQTINAKPGDWFGPGSTAHLLRTHLMIYCNEPDLALFDYFYPLQAKHWIWLWSPRTTLKSPSF